MRIQYTHEVFVVLSEESAKWIIDNYFTPQFKRGHFFEGIRDGIAAIAKRLP